MRISPTTEVPWAAPWVRPGWRLRTGTACAWASTEAWAGERCAAWSASATASSFDTARTNCAVVEVSVAATGAFTTSSVPVDDDQGDVALAQPLLRRRQVGLVDEVGGGADVPGGGVDGLSQGTVERAHHADLLGMVVTTLDLGDDDRPRHHRQDHQGADPEDLGPVALAHLARRHEPDVATAGP